MPAISHLDRARRSGARAVGVGSAPVPADHLGARMDAQPGRERVCFPVREQVDGLAGLDVDQQRAVDAAPAEREIIHPEDGHRPARRAGQRHHQAQQAGPAGQHAQQPGQPGPRPPGQRHGDRAQHRRQRRGPPRIPRGQALDLLRERGDRAVRVAAEEPPHRQPDQHPPAADRGIGQPPPIAAVHPARGPAARRARGLLRPRTSPDT